MTNGNIGKTKELPTTSNNILQMIAEAGYAEWDNFQHAFKRATGCTPGEYRRKNQLK